MLTTFVPVWIRLPPASKDDRNTRDRMIKEILKAVETQSVIDSKGRDALYVGTNRTKR